MYNTEDRITVRFHWWTTCLIFQWQFTSLGELNLDHRFIKSKHFSQFMFLSINGEIIIVFAFHLLAFLLKYSIEIG